MMSKPRSHGTRRWFVRVLYVALLASFPGGASTAAERFVVTRDGRKVPIIRSTTELAVTLKPTDDVEQVVRRLEPTLGRLEDMPYAPNSRFKLLRAEVAARVLRAHVRQDPAVEGVHPMVRYPGSDAPIACTGTINVKVRAELTAAEMDGLWADHGLTVVRQVEGLERVFLVKPEVEGADELLRAELLAEDTRTHWAQPNFRIPVRRHQVTPSDEYYSQQWHLNNTGQVVGIADADIDAPEAWLLSQGQDVILGMFDDACDVDHEDLRANYIGEGHDPSLSANADGFDDPRPKQLGDFHGTSVMGLAVARANALGVRGVAHLSQFTASRGLGQGLTDAEVASVYTFARQQDVDVHINSWGLSFGTRTPAIIEDAIETAFLEGRDIDGQEGPERPRGMVLLFSSGNGINNFGPGVQVEAGRELATLPTVIGVGASTSFDTLTSYSNFGPEIDVLAPGGGDFAGIRTTDVDDNAGYVEEGLNVGGVNPFDGSTELDPEGLYTNSFQGTSAACPIAAGTAALIVSANPSLTATDVRLILEHTADRIDEDDADYDGITHRSLRYGYGRINARSAAQAAVGSLTNGGRTWPERVANVRTSTNTLRWLQNGNPLEYPDEEQDQDSPSLVLPPTTDEFLVLQSDAPFDFVPQDGSCYDSRQLGCGNAALQPLPENVTVAAVGCQSLACGTDVGGSCIIGEERCIEFIPSAGVRYFAIYGRSFIGRYSFGVRADTNGDVLDEGQLPPGGEGTGGGTIPGGGEMPIRGPSVTIMTSPPSPEGNAPLTVNFTGNAASPVGLQIDDSRTSWDFDLDDLLQNGITVDAATRNAQFTYTAPSGETRVYTARLTMYDVAGNVGFAQVNVRVVGQGSTSGSGGALDEEIRIIVREPNGAEEVTQGVSPFAVEMFLDTTAEVQSISWDLGDGTIVKTVQVSHTYENTTTQELSLPVSATVDIRSTGGSIVRRTATKQISVLPGDPVSESPDVSLPGTGASGGGSSSSSGMCGLTGMLPLGFLFLSLIWMRRCR